MGNGWVKLMRTEKVEQLLKYPYAWTLLSQIALRGRWNNEALNPYNLELGEALVGDYLTGGMSEQQYRTAKKQLTKFKIATFKPTNRGTIAKLIDESIYDINLNAGNGQHNRQATDNLTGSQRTPNGQPTTNQEEKKKRTKELKKIYSPNSEEFRLAELLFSLIADRKSDYKKPDLQEWAKQIDLMIKKDKRNPDAIEKIIHWCQRDNFWRNNILSTNKLREHFDKLELKMNERKSDGKCATFNRNYENQQNSVGSSIEM